MGVLQVFALAAVSTGIAVAMRVWLGSARRKCIEW